MVRFFLCGIAVLSLLISKARAADTYDQPLVSVSSAIGASAPPAPDGTQVHLKSIPRFLKRVFMPVLPASSNSFRIEDERIEEVLESPSGFVVQLFDGQVNITPQADAVAGYARVRTSERELQLSIAVLEPYRNVQQGRLNGYRIGEYAANPRMGLDSYRLPDGFVPLTEATKDLWVSDHYRLRDFQCKLDGASKFLVLRPEALIKLELLQRKLNQAGVGFERFTVMSAFRTPFYNSRIGNDTVYSRHLYGDAMDIYVDRNDDGNMDDINRDGTINQEDARHLMRVAEEIDHSKEWGWLRGGAGVYRANSAHGPFLHIDVRGYIARWGA